MSMQLQIVSGSPGVKFQAPNKFTFNMPYSSDAGDLISLKSLRLYYSWFNITSAKGNNQFSYIWTNGTTYPVNMPNGIYSFADFQGFFEQVMFANGHYLINSAGQPVYYVKFQSNAVYYRISLTCLPVPASLPAGFTAPPGFVFQATTVPRIIIPATAIQSYLGFPAATYPAATQAALFQANSTNAPQVTDISSLMLQSNLVYNEYAPDSRTLATFGVPPGTAAGSLISEVPAYADWVEVHPNKQFKEVILEIVDQNSNPIVLNDTAGFICNLSIKRMKK